MPCSFNWKKKCPEDDCPCHPVASQHVHSEEAPHLCAVTACKHYIYQVVHDNPSCLVVTSNHLGAWREVEGNKIADGVEALWLLVSRQIQESVNEMTWKDSPAAISLNGLLHAMNFKTGSYRVSLNVLLDMLRTK